MSRVSPRLVGLGLIAAVLAVAGILTWADLRLASSQALSVVVKRTSQEVPLDDPLAKVWDIAPATEIPLSAQQVTVPMGGGSIRAVTVRALHDGERIYFRLEWEDPTRDVSSFGSQQFRDAAAIQFPAGGDSSLPSFCMGQADGRVNIWHWKADWQEDIDRGFVKITDVYPNTAVDYYPFEDDVTFYPGRAVGNLLSQTERTTPVENLVATGFGTLTSAQEQPVQGRGIWQGGKWYVVFAREMKSDDPAYTPFTTNQTTNVAFAVWDGSQGERDGMKSVSQFAELKVEEAPASEGGGDRALGFILLGVFLGLAAISGAAMVILRRRRRMAP